jgi:RHS repeat-associated protein
VIFLVILAERIMTFPKIGTSQTPVNNRPSSYNNGSATINFTYDNSGNMTAAGATTYQWDGANRLKSVNGGTSGSYGFDGIGQRVKKTEGGQTIYYVYSTFIGDAVMEVNSAGVQRAYVSGGRGQMVALRSTDGNFYWIHKDHLGSGRKMTNTSGNLTYRAEFDPYGKLLFEWSSSSQPNLNSKKFTGYERDTGSGLDYAQARMYSSEWGRFMSPDPLSSSITRSPKRLNRYTFVSGDPVNFKDRRGTCQSVWLPDEMYSAGGSWFDLPCMEDPLVLQPEQPPAPPQDSGFCEFYFSISFELETKDLSFAAREELRTEIRRIYQDAGALVTFYDFNGRTPDYTLKVVKSVKDISEQFILQDTEKKPDAVGVTGVRNGVIDNSGWVILDRLSAAIEKGSASLIASYKQSATLSGLGLGRAGAHEIGHYLLGYDNDLVSRPGIMRGKHPANDWILKTDEVLNNWRFTSNEEESLSIKCGGRQLPA